MSSDPGKSRTGRRLELLDVEGSTRLRLRVKSGARRDALLGVHAGALKVGVTAAAERGRANRAVLGLLAEVLGLPPSALRLLAGHRSPDKTVLLPLGVREAAARLGVALEGRGDGHRRG